MMCLYDIKLDYVRHLSTRVLDPSVHPEEQTRLPKHCSKVLIYCSEQCEIVMRQSVSYGKYSVVKEVQWQLQSGVHVMCMCFYESRRSVIDFYPSGNKCVLRVFKHKEEEIFCLYCAPKNPDLFSNSAAHLALQGKTFDQWIKDFQNTCGTTRSYSKTIVDNISCSVFQHSLLYFNLLKRNNEACRTMLKYLGHFCPLQYDDSRYANILEEIKKAKVEVNFDPYYEKYTPEWWSLEIKRRLRIALPKRKYRIIYSYRSF
jgi:hypothetical protein